MKKVLCTLLSLSLVLCFWGCSSLSEASQTSSANQVTPPAEAASLSQLGFTFVDNGAAAALTVKDATITISHDQWGKPSIASSANSVSVTFNLFERYTFSIRYYPANQFYLVNVASDHNPLTDYFYDAVAGRILYASDKKTTEQAMTEVFDGIDTEDVLLAPIKTIIPKVLRDTVGENITDLDMLYALPFAFETSGVQSLVNLGFKLTTTDSGVEYLFEQKTPQYYNVEVYNPQWGNGTGDGYVRFFTPVNADKYGLVITYFSSRKMFEVGLDDRTDGSGAKFEYTAQTKEHTDIWCGKKDMTVEEYFKNAFNDPAIQDIYQHSIDTMEQYIRQTFNLSVEELYALPTGE